MSFRAERGEFSTLNDGGERGMLTLHSFISTFPSREGLGVCDTHKSMHSNTPPSLLIVIQSDSEKSRKHPVIMLRYVLEILPPFGRLNDNYYKMTSGR